MQLGLAGTVRSKKKRTTIPAGIRDWPSDLVSRKFQRRGTKPALGHVTFIVDAFNLYIVGAGGRTQAPYRSHTRTAGNGDPSVS
jgi:hypothetical protein